MITDLRLLCRHTNQRDELKDVQSTRGMSGLCWIQLYSDDIMYLIVNPLAAVCLFFYYSLSIILFSIAFYLLGFGGIFCDDVMYLICAEEKK